MSNKIEIDFTIQWDFEDIKEFNNELIENPDQYPEVKEFENFLNEKLPDRSERLIESIKYDENNYSSCIYFKRGALTINHNEILSRSEVSHGIPFGYSVSLEDTESDSIKFEVLPMPQSTVDILTEMQSYPSAYKPYLTPKIKITIPAVINACIKTQYLDDNKGYMKKIGDYALIKVNIIYTRDLIHTGIISYEQHGFKLFKSDKLPKKKWFSFLRG
jgi:hypothetical protein